MTSAESNPQLGSMPDMAAPVPISELAFNTDDPEPGQGIEAPAKTSEEKLDYLYQQRIQAADIARRRLEQLAEEGSDDPEAYEKARATKALMDAELVNFEYEHDIRQEPPEEA